MPDFEKKVIITADNCKFMKKQPKKKTIKEKIVKKFNRKFNCEVVFRENRKYKKNSFGKIKLQESTLNLTYKDKKIFFTIHSRNRDEYENLINFISYLIYFAKCKLDDIGIFLDRFATGAELAELRLIICDNIVCIRQNIDFNIKIDIILKEFRKGFIDSQKSGKEKISEIVKLLDDKLTTTTEQHKIEISTPPITRKKKESLWQKTISNIKNFFKHTNA